MIGIDNTNKLNAEVYVWGIPAKWIFLAAVCLVALTLVLVLGRGGRIFSTVQTGTGNRSETMTADHGGVNARGGDGCTNQTVIGVQNITNVSQIIPRRDSPFYNAIASGEFEPEKISAISLQMLSVFDVGSRNLMSAYDAMDLETINYESHRVKNLVDDVLDGCEQISKGLAEDLQERIVWSCDIICEAALTHDDFDVIIEHGEKVMKRIGRKPVRLQAMHDYAVMMKQGVSARFPTDDDITKIMKWDLPYRTEYLRFFAQAGVLEEGLRISALKQDYEYCDWGPALN